MLVTIDAATAMDLSVGLPIKAGDTGTRNKKGSSMSGRPYNREYEVPEAQMHTWRGLQRFLQKRRDRGVPVEGYHPLELQNARPDEMIESRNDNDTKGTT